MTFKGLHVLALAPALNEAGKIGAVVARVPRGIVDEILVVDDGSTDDTAKEATAQGATVLSLGETLGVGAAIRRGYEYGVSHAYDVAVVMAGNNKDAPEEIPLLLQPIAAGLADLVQGSRYLRSGSDFGAMPLYRKVATKVHPFLFNWIAGTQLTDTTNGFRAVTGKLLTDPRLNLHQAWLDEYELEVYLLYKTVKLGYQIAEVPVSKIYPPRALGQTKMRPIAGWWSILRPIVFLGLGFKR